MAKTGKPRGRKPAGPHHGNMVMFSVRVRPEVRKGLEREAERNGVSLSQEIQTRLENSLNEGRRRGRDALYGRDEAGVKRNRKLGNLIGQLAARIERTTGGSWRKDRYTYEAFAAAVALLLPHLAPKGVRVITDTLRKSLAPLGDDFALQMTRPESLATWEIGNLWRDLVSTELPPLDLPKGTHYAEEFYEFPAIRKALGLKGDGK